jgi:hypothetical protein
MTDEFESTDNDEIESSIPDECDICQRAPCEWVEFGIPSLQNVSEAYSERRSDGSFTRLEDGAVVDAKSIRRAIYLFFTYMKLDHFGLGEKLPIPPCVSWKAERAYTNP